MTMPKDGWQVHLAAVVLITIACLASILWLSLTNHPIPDVFTYVSTGGATYLLGTYTATKYNDTKPPQQ